MKKTVCFIIANVFFLSLISLWSCSDNKRIQNAQNIVINELMASNRTGLLTHKGKAFDWIELKNTGTDSINLKGFELTVIEEIPDSIIEEEGFVDENEMTWTFPDNVVIGGGECLVVFANKKKDKEENTDSEAPKKEKKKKTDKPKTPDSDKSLIADLKFPKNGGKIQFKAPNGQVIRELEYGKLEADQALALQPDSTYKATYWQSPGFDNTPEGYEAAALLMDDQRKDPLKIWELMSRASQSGDNWVELKNTGTTEIDLSAYSIAKKKPKTEGWKLPARKLQPGEIITVQLAGNENSVSMKAPFKLGDSETLILSKDGKFVDGVCAKQTIYGGSIGRMNGKKGFFYFSTPTRGGENGENGRRYIADKPEFDRKPGLYPKSDKLTLRLKDTGKKVHYTLDGSEPNINSPLLKDSLLLTKGTVIRAFTEGDSINLRSNIGTTSYLLGADHQIPVMNIAVNNNDLYNYNTGIYVAGPGGETDDWPHKGANYWKKWTKKAHMEFFDGEDGFSTDCGLRIFGGFSRAEAKKSFRLKFRGEYGDSEVDYDFFKDGEPMDLKDIVLRAGAQDYNRCMVRDEFFTSLMKKESPTILTQKYRPVALYINAEYFGLYYIREKIDKHFMARKLNIPTDSINIIMSIGYNEEGPKTAYLDLMKYVGTNPMTDNHHYNYMKDNVDFLGLIDYKLGQMYSGNTDIGNVRYVRSTSPESDKKWHFVFYDLDASWVGNKSVEYYLASAPGADASNVTAHHNRMINRLLQNPEFRALFLERVSHHMTHTFSPQNTTAVFDNLVAQIKPEMKRNCERWPQLSYEGWEKNIADFRKKFDERHKIMLDGIREYLKVTDAENKKYFGHLGY